MGDKITCHQTAAPDAHRGDSFVTQDTPTITYRLSHERFIPREVSLEVSSGATAEHEVTPVLVAV